MMYTSPRPLDSSAAMEDLDANAATLPPALIGALDNDCT